MRLRRLLPYLVIALLVALPRLASFAAPVWSVDEGFTAASADLLLRGGTLYRDAVDTRGPVTHAVFAAVFGMAGRYAMAALHGVLAALLVLVAWGVFAIGRRLGGERAGWLGALVFAFLATFGYPPDDTLAFHTEWCLVGCTTLASWLLLRRLAAAAPPAAAVAAGALFALGAFCKQPGALDLGAALVFLAWLATRPAGARAATWRAAAQLATGAATVCAGVALWFAAEGAWREFAFYTWTYNWGWYVAVGSPLARVLHAVTGLAIPLAPSRLGFLVVAGAVVAWRRPAAGRDAPDALARYPVFWLAATLVGAAWSGRNFGHYYLAALPPAALLAGVAADMAWRGLRGAATGPGGRAVGIGLAAALAFALGGDTVRVFAHQAAADAAALERRLAPVARYVAANSAPRARVFVWGFAPELYVLARRTPASRYTYFNYVTGFVPWTGGDPDTAAARHVVPGALDSLLADLRRHAPPLVVDATPGDYMRTRAYAVARYPALAAYIRTHYAVRREFAGAGGVDFRVWERRGARIDRPPANP